MLPIRDHMCLSITAKPYRFPAARVNDMLELTGMTEAVFWRHVHVLVDTAAAMAEYPAECARLRRLRDQRRAARSGLRAS